MLSLWTFVKLYNYDLCYAHFSLCTLLFSETLGGGGGEEKQSYLNPNRKKAELSESKTVSFVWSQTQWIPLQISDLLLSMLFIILLALVCLSRYLYLLYWETIIPLERWFWRYWSKHELYMSSVQTYQNSISLLHQTFYNMRSEKELKFGPVVTTKWGSSLYQASSQKWVLCGKLKLVLHVQNSALDCLLVTQFQD